MRLIEHFRPETGVTACGYGKQDDCVEQTAHRAEASVLKSEIGVVRSDVDRLEAKLHGLLENRFARKRTQKMVVI